MINATRMGPKLAMRTPYSQPGHREKMSWFIWIDLGYYLGRVSNACLWLQLSIGAFWSLIVLMFPYSTLTWLCSQTFLHAQGGLPTSFSLFLPLGLRH